MDEILTPDQWTDLQIILKQKFPQLTDADLQYHEAFETDLLKMVEYELRKPRIKTHATIAERHHRRVTA